jgi:hypothetical protein
MKAFKVVIVTLCILFIGSYLFYVNIESDVKAQEIISPTEKVYSNFYPDTIWLRKTVYVDDQLYLILRIRSNVVEVQKDNMDGQKFTQYEYDEYEVRYKVPDNITTSDNLMAFIAREQVNIDAKISKETAWKAIAVKPIDELRSKLSLEVSKASLE